MFGCSPGGLLSPHLVNIKRWLLFPRMGPVVSALTLVCFPERQTAFLQFWPSVTLARCYIFTSPFRLSSHTHIMRKQCLSEIVACSSIHSGIHSPWTFVTLQPQTSICFISILCERLVSKKTLLLVSGIEVITISWSAVQTATQIRRGCGRTPNLPRHHHRSKKEGTDQWCSQLFVVCCTNLALMKDRQVVSHGTHHPHCPTWWWQHDYVGEFVSCRYLEDGWMYLNKQQSWKKKKKVLLQKTWDWAGGSLSKKTPTRNGSKQDNFSEFVAKTQNCYSRNTSK